MTARLGETRRDEMQRASGRVMFRCPSCGSGALTPVGDFDASKIVKGVIVCATCGQTYDVIWGVPYLGHFALDEILSLVELAANAREDNSYGRRAEIEKIEILLEEYHRAADKDAFVAHCPDETARAPWFLNRYNEWLDFEIVSEGIDLNGLKVLDVGAGSGHDSVRLARRGAELYAFEYNPVLVRRGREVVPEAKWFGGSSCFIPFANESFDVVCCNAALHHMTDTPSAIYEMLRVLKPGGWLLTTGDSFRSTQSKPEVEYEIFNSHPGVLLGINETIPNFGELTRVLVEHEDKLEIRFLTSIVYGITLDPARGPETLKGRRWWPFSAREQLSSVDGGIAMKVKVTAPLRLPARLQEHIGVRAGDYAEVLADFEKAILFLLPLVSPAIVDLPFPGDKQSKFELLNGWQKPIPDCPFRRGYKRARWLLMRPRGSAALGFLVRSESDRGTLEVRINGRCVPVHQSSDWRRPLAPPADNRLVPISRHQWARLSVPLDGIMPGERFLCELRLQSDEQSTDFEFDENQIFCVKDRAFV